MGRFLKYFIFIGLYFSPILLVILTPMHIHIPYRNLMIEICPTDFSGKRISRIIGNFKMPIDTSVVGINPAVMPLAEKDVHLRRYKGNSWSPLFAIQYSSLEVHVLLRQAAPAVSVRIRRQTNPFHAMCQS